MERAAPCCIGVVRDSSGLQGAALTIGGAPAYFAEPAAGKEKKVGVLIVHDIWGFNIPNSKYIADYLAKNGFDALLPNLYVGVSSLDGWSQPSLGITAEFDDGEALEGTKWDAWWTEITSDSFWKLFHERVAATKHFLVDAVGLLTSSALSRGHH